MVGSLPCGYRLIVASDRSRGCVYVVWASEPVDLHEPGPWQEAYDAGHGIWFVDSTESLSRVYHDVKWRLPDDAALLVVPAEHRPKARGLAPGAVTWLRRLGLPAAGRH
jgi:hypothetical protein